ncbi:hypothetical protein [Caballeronia sordidicola]|uniref:hypothetical protein n=1 Tax=Caballeronia sordidicola TaxID=196367 RepID=UPI00094C49B8|nr:hypothetical protein [Caballeronia sordidicola]
MAFKYDADRQSAIDADSGETVDRTSAYSDIAGVVIYRYRKANDSIEIYVSSRSEPAANGSRDVTVAALINEGALWSSFLAAYPEQESAEAVRAHFEALKTRISEAVFEISSYGGHLLKFSPSFHVEFVPSFESA